MTTPQVFLISASILIAGLCAESSEGFAVVVLIVAVFFALAAFLSAVLP